MSTAKARFFLQTMLQCLSHPNVSLATEKVCNTLRACMTRKRSLVQVQYGPLPQVDDFTRLAKQNDDRGKRPVGILLGCYTGRFATFPATALWLALSQQLSPSAPRVALAARGVFDSPQRLAQGGAK